MIQSVSYSGNDSIFWRENSLGKFYRFTTCLLGTIKTWSQSEQLNKISILINRLIKLFPNLYFNIKQFLLFRFKLNKLKKIKRLFLLILLIFLLFTLVNLRLLTLILFRLIILLFFFFKLFLLFILFLIQNLILGLINRKLLLKNNLKSLDKNGQTISTKIALNQFLLLRYPKNKRVPSVILFKYTFA